MVGDCAASNRGERRLMPKASVCCFIVLFVISGKNKQKNGTAVEIQSLFPRPYVKLRITGGQCLSH